MGVIYDIYENYESLGNPHLVIIQEQDQNFLTELKLYTIDDEGDLHYLSDLSIDQAVAYIEEGLAQWY